MLWARRRIPNPHPDKGNRIEANQGIGPVFGSRPIPRNYEADMILPRKYKEKRYNPPQSMICHKGLLVPVLILLCLLPAYGTTNWDGPAADLAKQIAASAGPGPVKLLIVNRSSIPTDEIPGIRRILEQDLRAAGVTPVSSSDVPTSIRVTLSQNARQGLWVAEIQEGNDSRVVMSYADIAAAISPSLGSHLVLNKALLFVQATPVLDVGFVSLGGDRRMLVLDPEKLTSYRLQNGSWGKDQVFAIAHTQPFPRDIRGRILPASGNLFDVYLPGVLCNGTEAQGQIALACGDSDDPWPAADSQKAFYNRTRNFFSGVLVPGFGTDIGPFYSAAELVRPRGTIMVFSRVSGETVYTDGTTLRSVTGARDWGSDLAGIRSGCGGGGQLLVDEAGEMLTESIRAYEIPEREAVPVSAALSFNGQVTAMWPEEDSAATVIIHNQQSSQYEAYRVSVSCN